MRTSKTAADLTAEAEAREDLRHYAAEIEYFETHDLSEELANSPEAHFEINLPPRRKRYALDAELSEMLTNIASQRGISPEVLLNQWVREKTAESETAGAAG